MKYDPDHHHRRFIRLKGYDYSQPGAYFVTLCLIIFMVLLSFVAMMVGARRNMPQRLQRASTVDM